MPQGESTPCLNNSLQITKYMLEEDKIQSIVHRLPSSAQKYFKMILLNVCLHSGATIIYTLQREEPTYNQKK